MERVEEACIRPRPMSESRLKRDGLDPGTVAPSFQLVRIGGGEVSLGDYRGHRVLLVFSDPECAPCNELAPSLEQIHRRSARGRVLMISRRGVEANRAKIDRYGLTFPVALQRQWEVSRQYAIFATPVAYLINADGIVEEHVAIGIEAVLTLAEGRRKMIDSQIATRLEGLKRELEVGQRELDRIERHRTYLRETVLRIGGAIQVLEELESHNDSPQNGQSAQPITVGSVDSDRST